MKHEFIQTEDGSSTLYVPELNEHYHSVHGALQESQYIFIQTGIEYYNRPSVYILEAGFGTGLNAFLTLVYARQHNMQVVYHSFEKYPLAVSEAEQLNYTNIIDCKEKSLFMELHDCEWEKDIVLTPHFTLHKHQADFREVDFPPQFDVVFFDAFNPDVQPHLWTEDVLSRFCNALKPDGIFVTYCVKGIVKQALRNQGMAVKRLPGPPGKREILRATKTSSL